MKIVSKIVGMLLYITILSLTIFAQQNPTFTTDDVLTPPPRSTSDSTSKVASNKVENSNSLPDKVAKSEKKELIAGEKKDSSTPTISVEEKAWNDSLIKKQDELNTITRHADQTELQLTTLKNELRSATARSTSEQDQLIQKMNELTAQMNSLRTAAKLAQEEVTRLLNTGQAQNYKVADPQASSTDSQGAAEKTAKLKKALQQELQDAQLQVQVLELRFSNNQSETRRTGNGDNFSLNRLRTEKEGITNELEKKRAKIEELTRKIQSLH